MVRKIDMKTYCTYVRVRAGLTRVHNKRSGWSDRMRTVKTGKRDMFLTNMTDTQTGKTARTGRKGKQHQQEVKSY